MNKTERLYAFAMRRRVVNVDDLSDYARRELGKDYKYLYTKYLHRLLAQGKLVRVTRGVYAARNVYSDDVYDNIDTPPNKYLVASKLRDDYYLSYHTALELQGCAYTSTTSCTLSVPEGGTFRPFRFGLLSFDCVQTGDLATEIDVERVLGQPIRVSSPSRTFVECSRRLDLCGGLEEFLRSVDGLRGVTEEGVEASLATYGYDLLYRSVGFFLELMKRESPFYGAVSDGFLESLRGRGSMTPRYLVKGAPSRLDRYWDLYVPRYLDDLMTGV